MPNRLDNQFVMLFGYSLSLRRNAEPNVNKTQRGRGHYSGVLCDVCGAHIATRLLVLLLFFFLWGDLFKKAKGYVVSNRIGMKFGAIFSSKCASID